MEEVLFFGGGLFYVRFCDGDLGFEGVGDGIEKVEELVDWWGVRLVFG